jgi:cell division protein FtsW (lipid II flippase)
VRFWLPIRHEWGILLGVLPLCAIGISTLHMVFDTDPDRWLAARAMNQLVFMGMGVIVMTAAIAVGYQRFGRWSYPMFAVCVLMLAYIVLDHVHPMPLVDAKRAVRRWITVGSIQLQPSELMKIVYVLALGWYLRYRRNYRTLTGLLQPFALTLLPMALILVQPDLGTVLLFLPVLFAMLYAAGAKTKHLLLVIGLAVLASPFFWHHIRGYQRLRVTGVFLQSETVREYLKARPHLWDGLRGKGNASDPEDRMKWRRELTDWSNQTGYQLVSSKRAIGSGGLTGQGREGVFVQYDKFLPERENDFIFAMVAHQWGLVGSLAIVVLGYESATCTNDPFGRLVAVGMSTMIAVQALTNLCMTVGIGPVTGVTLPFVSAGGSSIVSCFLLVGILISVAHRRPMLIANPPFVFNEEAERFSPA